MKDFEKFLMAKEAGISSKVCIFDSNLLRFNEARKRGWSDDPRDAGGATQTGVTLNTYRSYCRRKGLPEPSKNTLRNIPYAHWREIVKEFWDCGRCDEILSEPVAWIVADWVWGSGPKVLRNVQETVNRLLSAGCGALTVAKLKVDGVIGAKSIAAINALDGRELFDALKSERVEYIEKICRNRPANKVFKKGWLNRLDAIRFEGLVY